MAAFVYTGATGSACVCHPRAKAAPPSVAAACPRPSPPPRPSFSDNNELE
jgi:hypothetical protein